MKIAVYGATGNVGTEIVTEAVSRGHEVTGLSRRGGASAAQTNSVGDFADTASVLEVAAANDVIVVSAGPSRSGEPHQNIIDAHDRVLAAKPDARIVVVGGAGSLWADGVRLKDLPTFPDFVKPEADTMTTVLENYLASDGLDWTIISPAPMIAAGERTGSYKVALEEPAGEKISREDFAVAIIDEIENPQHRGRRYTVAN